MWEIIGYEVQVDGKAVIRIHTLQDVKVWLEDNVDYDTPAYTVVAEDASGGFWELSQNERRFLYGEPDSFEDVDVCFASAWD